MTVYWQVVPTTRAIFHPADTISLQESMASSVWVNIFKNRRLWQLRFCQELFSFFSKIHPLHNIDPWAPGALGQDVRQQLR